MPNPIWTLLLFSFIIIKATVTVHGSLEIRLYITVGVKRISMLYIPLHSEARSPPRIIVVPYFLMCALLRGLL